MFAAARTSPDQQRTAWKTCRVKVFSALRLQQLLAGAGAFNVRIIVEVEVWKDSRKPERVL